MLAVKPTESEAAEYFRLIAESSDEAIFGVTLEGRITTWSRAAEQTFGYSSEEAVGKSLSIIVPPSREQDKADLLDGVRRGESVEGLRIELQCKDRTTIAVQMTLSPIRDAVGDIAGGLAIIRDLSAAARAEGALAESEERFRLAFEESPVGMVLCGRDYTIFRVNRVICALLGYEENELIGKTIAEITHPDDVDTSLEHADRVFGGTVPGYVLPKRYVTKQGETRWARLTVTVVHDETGRPIYGLGMIEDLTGGREAEKAMRRSERLASIGTFAAGVAHQINNPLGGVLLAAQFALASQKSPDSPALMRKALEDIEADARRCGDIVRSVLRFARQDTLETSPCTLDELVRSAIRLTRKDAEGRADVLFLEAQGKLPEILVSRTEMEQAISNVLRNAVKSKPEGVRVVIQTDYSDDKAFLIIRDDGDGVPEEHLEYLFDPFYTTRKELGGSGLGLSMAHAIVTAHGGTIDVTSSLTSGTTVIIELPLPTPCQEDLR